MLVRFFAVSLAAICLFGTARSQAQLAPGDDDGSDVEVDVISGDPTITTPAPGEMVIDASGGNDAIEVPANGMVFNSEDDLITWAADNLNGVPTTDDSGRRGIWGKLTVYGKLHYGDENANISQQVDDYMVAKLGGRSGVVIVNGQEYCLKENGCDSGSSLTSPGAKVNVYSAPSATGRCDPTNQFCINGESWKKEIPASFFPIYRTIGSDVEETGSGFEITHHFCWKAGIIPWSCARQSGHDHLSLRNSYSFGTGMATGAISDGGAHDDVESIDVRLWSLFVSVKSNGVPGTTSTAEAEIGGVCAGESGNSPKFQTPIAISTSAGSVSDQVCQGI